MNMHTLFHITQITTTSADNNNNNDTNTSKSNNTLKSMNGKSQSKKATNDNETFSFQGNFVK